MKTTRNSGKPVAIDLFCGAGGLTLGLKSAGFRVAAAVEAHPIAAATYRANHRATRLFEGDIRKIEPEHLREMSGARRIDLLAACPPCQGFTSLTSKHRRDDPRNALVREIVRFVHVLRPRAVMLENVVRLASSESGRAKLTPVTRALRKLGYEVDQAVLQAADFGTPQLRKRLVLFATARGIDPPVPTHSRYAEDGREAWRTVRDAIGGQPNPRIFDQRAQVTFSTLADWHVVRRLGEANLNRLRAATPGGARWDMPNHLRPQCHKGSSSGFKNVYGRMTWDDPSPTITGGCTSPSKGRFGHPRALRTISVKEAGLLQEFPEDYIIASNSIDRTCEMIGNALPVSLGETTARHVLTAL